MISPKRGDGKAAHGSDIETLAQETSIGRKLIEGYAHLLPCVRNLEGRLIKLPRKDRPPCPQVHKIGLVVATDTQDDAACSVWQRRIEFGAGLNEPATISRAHHARQPQNGLIPVPFK